MAAMLDAELRISTPEQRRDQFMSLHGAAEAALARLEETMMEHELLRAQMDGWVDTLNRMMGGDDSSDAEVVTALIIKTQKISSQHKRVMAHVRRDAAYVMRVRNQGKLVRHQLLAGPVLDSGESE